MNKLILTAVFAAVSLGFTRGVHAEGVSETNSVLVATTPYYTLTALSAATAAPSKVIVLPEEPHFYVGPGDPFSGTWWDGFWSENLHGQSCMNPGGGGGHYGYGGGAYGRHGSCQGSGHCGGLAGNGRCGGHRCNCHDDAGGDCGCLNQDAADPPQPELDADFEPPEPDSFDGNSRQVAPLDTPATPEVPSRVTPPRNVLPKNALEKPQPGINSAAANTHTVPQKTVLRFRVDAVGHPVICDPEVETANVLSRKTLR